MIFKKRVQIAKNNTNVKNDTNIKNDTNVKNDNPSKITGDPLSKRELELEKERRRLESLKERKDYTLNSINIMEADMEKLEAQSREQHELNKKIFRKRVVIISTVLLLVILGDIFWMFIAAKQNDQKLADYTASLNQMEIKYQEALESMLE